MRKARPRAAARRTVTDAKIAEAVLDIIRGQGVRAVTVDAVTARSGVAKTTIYRRYVDRFELLAGVLETLAPVPDHSDHAVSKRGMALVLRELQDVFQERVGLADVGQVLAGEDSFLRQWREKVVTPGLDALRGYLERGTAEGAFDPSVDRDLVVDMIVGGMIVHHARSGEVDEGWAASMAEVIWPLLETSAD